MTDFKGTTVHYIINTSGEQPICLQTESKTDEPMESNSMPPSAPPYEIVTCGVSPKTSKYVISLGTAKYKSTSLQSNSRLRI